MNDEQTPLIELESVSFFAQDKLVVDSISCIIPSGKTTAIVGPSGGGKSTVLKLAAGLIVPSSGKVLHKGNDISLMNRAKNLEFRKEASFVFQDSALWANQSLLQILELPLKIHFPNISETKRKERIQEVLSQVGYRKSISIRPSNLSMGEQKLIAFARAILCNPSMLFLDEWTESLDDTAARRLVTLVKKKQDAGNTIVFVSHNFQIIKELSHMIMLIEEGHLTLNATAEEFEKDSNLARTIEKGIAQ